MPLAEIEEKKQNPHLEERAIVGAKKYRVMSEKFAEDHPVLNTLGYAAGLAPFIVPAAAATAAVKWLYMGVKKAFLYRHCTSPLSKAHKQRGNDNSNSTMDRISDCQSYPCLCVARQVIFGTK